MTFLARLLTLLTGRWIFRRARRKSRPVNTITNFRLWARRRPF